MLRALLVFVFALLVAVAQVREGAWRRPEGGRWYGTVRRVGMRPRNFPRAPAARRARPAVGHTTVCV
jgi:hypothetical protein